MTELDLYRFCEDKEMDWRGEKLIMWIYPCDVQSFADLLGDECLSEEGYSLNLRPGGCVAVDLMDVCEWFDIEPERIHPKEE